VSFIEENDEENLDAMDAMGFLSPVDVGQRLESFMTLSIEWPLTEGDALRNIIPPPPFRAADTRHTENCCAMSMEDIYEHWENGLMEPLEDWEDFDTEDTTNVGAELIVGYDENGFDHEGFDEGGFNQEEKHYRDIPVE
jgi:hypothetical protein